MQAVIVRVSLVILTAASLASAKPKTEKELPRQFTGTVRPFLAAYCIGCHSGSTPAAQFDLQKYASLADVVRDHPHWALVKERLESGQMPPKGLKQPDAHLRRQVIDWIDAVKTEEARKNAGDPGIVLARRLSKAEYNYSIRDLTGVDIAPAREFPVDPVNPEGFDNTGESLAMSPALMNKYLQAAREVSSHLVLGQDGIRFAPHPMLAESDREKYTIKRIVDFYDRQPTDYAAYFEAAWQYKHRRALGKESATLAEIAAETKVSPKYLPLVWGILEDPADEIGPIATLRRMWRLAPTPEQKQPELLRETCAKMRDYVVKLRRLTARQFASPILPGLSGTSQPLMHWKLRAYETHRRDFDRGALREEGEPAKPLPVMPAERGSGKDTVAVRNEILAIRARQGEPDLVVPSGQRERYEAAFARFSSVFPDAFYIRERGRFYPDDSEDKGRLLSAGFHNVMGYTRDDLPLRELILNDEQTKELDQLWLEFDTIADQTTRTYVQFFFNQSGEIDGRGRESGSFRPGDKAVTSEKVIFGIRDLYLARAERSNNPVATQSIHDHFSRVNATIRAVEKARLDAEPVHLRTFLDFASRAYRRPLAKSEQEDLLAYYRTLRAEKGLTHEDTMRDLAVLVLVSPDFCFHLDRLPPAEGAPVTPRRRSRVTPVKPLPSYALANRLSYFLWSSVPDQELLQHAAAGNLGRPDVLAAQVRRMLKDPRSRALATEFAGNWLDFRRFEDHKSVDRQRFPAFTNDLRKAMFEEPVRFLDDVIRSDRPVTDLLYAKHTFVNAVLARHYGMDEVKPKKGEWVRVNDATPFGRGGLLAMSVFLTQNSPGLRTSPVKRGYWVARKIIGETIPPPPPSVPELPDDEAKMNLPLRQMLAKHRENASCAACHARFDSFGLALEGYGPIGEHRTADLAGRPVETQADFPGGRTGAGIDGLRDYLRAHREKEFLENISRKLYAYALGRSLLLSDEPELEKMRAQFASRGYRLSTLIEAVVATPQFRNQRSPEVTHLRTRSASHAHPEPE